MFDNYPRAKELIERHHYDNEVVASTTWVQMTQEEAAINLAKVLLTYKSLTSASIPLKNMAKLQVDKDYRQIGDLLHVFAKEEGRSQLGLTNEGVTKLFAHIEIGGSRFRQKPIQE